MSDSGEHQKLGTTVYVDGFRSLKDFSVELTPGLNVLVGPNGSGKSNFIEFFDFLFGLLRGDATLAVSRAGGIARVFSQENLRKDSPSLSVEVRGVAAITPRRKQNISLRFFRYRYSLEVRFSKATSSLYIRSEQLKIGRLRDCANRATADQSYLGNIRIFRNSARSDIFPRVNVTPSLLKDTPTNPMAFTESLARRESLNDAVNRQLDRYHYSDADGARSFLTDFTRTTFPAIEAVRTAMTRGRSFNIAPQAARTPDDLSRPPFIDRTGAGLSATLHYLQSLKLGRPTRAGYAGPDVDASTLDSLVEWTKLIYPQLVDISVQADVHSGKYLPFLTISEKQGLKIPFQSASDGTVKWLALVALILTTESTFSLEEPENFLHPRMQQFLVELVRDSLSSGDPTAYFLLSTHSETLINECTPNEIIVMDFSGGQTTASRISNFDTVISEINRTGFGLGHYYVSNALS